MNLQALVHQLDEELTTAASYRCRRLAAFVRNEKIVPYCNKYKLKFHGSSNLFVAPCGYIIYDIGFERRPKLGCPRGTLEGDADHWWAEPGVEEREISSLLNMSLNGSALAGWMDDYSPEEGS